jgi:predicted nucleic acid-binding Zn ribbon protein
MDSNATSLELPPESEFDPGRTTIPREEIRQRQVMIVGAIIVVVVVLALLITGIILLASPGTDTERVRDIMIIFMALAFLLLSISMLVLIIQLATLINLLQNEIIPIIESTSETANTLRGTAVFMSDNLSEPVIKLNEYLAGFAKLFELIGLSRRR